MHIRLGRMNFDQPDSIACLGISRAKNGKLFRFRQTLWLIFTFLFLTGVPANGQDQGLTKEVIYKIYETQMTLLGETMAAGTLEKAKANELRNDLARIDTSILLGEEKKDVDEWLKSLVAYLDKLPESVAESGYRSWEPLRKCMTVLADHDITGTMAKADGYPQLAEKIDALLDMAKAILLVQLRLDTKALQEVAPITRAFVEYFYILTVLTGPENRNPLARCALLSMRPGEIKDEATMPVFLDLHNSLLSLSHEVRSKSQPVPERAFNKGKLPMVFLCNLLKKSPIEDAEIKKTGADENFLAVVKKLRETGKDDKCRSIVP